jgi:hypothetical protein
MGRDGFRKNQPIFFREVKNRVRHLAVVINRDACSCL